MKMSSGRVPWGNSGMLGIFRRYESISYFGETVYFHPGSHVAERAVREGVYERNVVNSILSLIDFGSIYIDVGANIGLLSLPILASRHDVRVVSIEASPGPARCLERTRHRAAVGERWSIVAKAVGSKEGWAPFFKRSNAFSAFDGVVDTKRGGAAKASVVPMTTLDRVWKEVGEGRVSVVKLDIEGGETAALAGAQKLIRQSRPHIILEWHKQNLAANGIDIGHIFHISRQFDYRVLSVESMSPLERRDLQEYMGKQEMILLSPAAVRKTAE